MLDIAINHEEELKLKFRGTWFKEKYKFYNYSTYCSDVELSKDTWNSHQFVSLDSEGNIIGYIEYEINRASENCSGLGIINFSDNSITFGKDLMQAIKDIFEKFRFKKLSFCVVVGNPAEKQYDKLVKKYNGRIVGVKERHAKLYDGKYYDVKLYEMTTDHYFSNNQNKEREQL